MSKKSIILSVLLVVAGFTMSFIPANRAEQIIRITSPDNRLDFTLVNRTGYTLDRVHLVASGQENWGGNILASDIIDTYQSKITFPNSRTEKFWDMKAHYKGYNESSVNCPVWRDIDLISYNKITVKWDAAKGTSTITKEFVKD